MKQILISGKINGIGDKAYILYNFAYQRIIFILSYTIKTHNKFNQNVWLRSNRCTKKMYATRNISTCILLYTVEINNQQQG